MCVNIKNTMSQY